MYDVTKKRERGNGYSYMEANSFPYNIPTYPKRIFFFNEGKEGLKNFERDFLRKN